MSKAPFWTTKTLDELSTQEWESLCDGCGRCCLVKIEEETTLKVHHTDIACRMLDCASGRCGDYDNRKRHVPDCVSLTPELVRSIDWLPPSCAYRLVANGEELYWWHPLVSGDPETVHQAGISVRGRVSCNDAEVGDEDWEAHVVRWPKQIPKKAARR